MKTTQRELTNWAIDQIKSKYPDDVALLIAIEGHALESDCHGECFDYFVPATERGNALATTFILDGVGHDLYPRSWQRIEKMAEFADDFHMGLADAIVLYYRNAEDLAKFEAYRAKQKANFADKALMYHHALEKLDAAMEVYRTLVFDERLNQVRMGAGYIAYFLAMSVAFINGRYYKKRLELPTVELADMANVPKDFIMLYEEIVEAANIDTLKSLSQRIIMTTRQFLEENKIEQAKEAPVINYQHLAEWYQEGSLSFRRMRIHCDEGNYRRVFVDALAMQSELNVIHEEFNLQEMDLLGVYDCKDLMPIKAQVMAIETSIIQTLNQNGVTLNQYDHLEAFLTKNS